MRAPRGCDTSLARIGAACLRGGLFFGALRQFRSLSPIPVQA
jgi:hypothetical protein